MPFFLFPSDLLTLIYWLWSTESGKLTFQKKTFSFTSEIGICQGKWRPLAPEQALPKGEKPSPHPGQLVFLKNGPLLPPHSLLAQQVSKGWAGLGWAGPPPHAQKHRFTAGQVLGSPEGPPCASDLAQRGRSWQPHRRSCSQMCLGLGDGALEHWQNWRLFCTPVVPVSHFYDTCHNPRCLHEQGTPGRVSLSFVNSVPSQVPDTP